MGGLASVALAALPLANQIGQTVREGQRLATDLRGNDRLKQIQASERELLQRRQSTDMAALRTETENQRTALKATAEADERRRQDALRRAMGRTRVKLASQGIDISDSGSGEALLLGLVNDTEAERAESQTLDRLREKALDDTLTARNQRNLLEAAELAERQRLQWLNW